MVSDRLSIRRRTLDAAKAHITIQGEVMYAASHLQEAFYHLFAIALSLERSSDFGAEVIFYNHTLAIWHILQSDKQQREMALVAISTIPTKLSLRPAIRRLKWATTKAGKLMEYRNVIAHSPVMFRGRQKGKRFEFIPSFGGFSTRPIARDRLNMIKGLRFWRTMRNDLLNLSEYVAAVNDQIRRLEVASRGSQLMGVPNSWPGRPRLPSLRRLQEIEQMLAPAARKPRRRSPPRSSRA